MINTGGDGDGDFVSGAWEPPPRTCSGIYLPAVTQLMTSEAFPGMGENRAGAGRNNSAWSWLFGWEGATRGDETCGIAPVRPSPPPINLYSQKHRFKTENKTINFHIKKKCLGIFRKDSKC